MTTQPEYAGFWVRVVANIIDFVILTASYLVVSLLLILMLSVDPAIAALGYLISIFGGLAYHILFVRSSWQATPGKRLLRLYVATRQGARMSFWRALLRILVLAIGPAIASLPFIALYVFGAIATMQDSNMAILIIAGVIGQVAIVFAWFAIAGWTRQKTALHDMICRTRVLHGRPAEAAVAAAPVRAEPALV